MNDDDRITFERRHAVRPRVERFTVGLDAEAAALLRVVAADWGMTQAQVVGLALRWFHGTGAADAGRVTISAVGQARIAAAVERAAMLADRPMLDPRVHGRGDGDGPG